MAQPPALALVQSLASAADFSAAVPILAATEIPLDANFCEKLHWQIDRWREAGDPIAEGALKAFFFSWEFRYRRVDIDHQTSPELRKLVLELMSQPDPGAMKGWVEARLDAFEPNTVEALNSVQLFAPGPLDEEKVAALYGIAGGVAQARGYRLPHYPQGIYRNVFVANLHDAYSNNRMRELMDQPLFFLPLGYTMAGILDAMRQRGKLGVDEQLTTFVNFTEALALHLSELPADNPGVGVAVYLYEYLLALYEAEGLDDPYAKTLANLGDAQEKAGASG